MSELPIQQGGLRVLSGIVPASSASTYGTHYSYLGVGGYVEVPNIEYRNSIPSDSNMNDEGYSTGRRRYGMMVYVIDDDKLFRLFPYSGSGVVSLETFTATTELEQVTMLSNNNGWIEVPDLSVLITGGTYFSGSSSIVLYDSTGGTVSITGITTTDVVNPGDGRVLVSTGNSESIFVAQSNMVFNGTNLNITGGTFITDSGGSLHSSAIAQFKSTTKGVLLPGMTTAQKNAIVNPTTGLTVYDSTIEDISVYTSSGWTGVIAERDNLQKVTERGNSTNTGLIISGTTYIVGSGTSSSTNSLIIQDLNKVTNFVFRDDGYISSRGALTVGTTTQQASGNEYLVLYRSQSITRFVLGNPASAQRNDIVFENSLGGYLKSSGDLLFATNNTDRLRIDKTSGNVLIGTTTDAGYKLDVNGSTRIVGSGSTTGNTFVTSNSANTQTFTIKDNGNILIGTTTDAGYKLDVNGTVRVQSNFLISNQFRVDSGRVTLQNNYNGGQGLYFADNSGSLSSGYKLVDFGVGQSFTLYNSGNYFGFANVAGTLLHNWTNSGNFNIGYGASDSAAKLGVGGSITAASAIARGVFFNNTLVAAANNDVLVGLDINPTFTNGAFTGVTNWGIRNYSSFRFETASDLSHGLYWSIANDGTQLKIFGSSYSGGMGYLQLNVLSGSDGMVVNGSSRNLTIKAAGSELNITPSNTIFNQNGTGESMRIVSSTKNVLIGTTTDAGFKLDVNGSANFSNNVVVTTASSGTVQLGNSTTSIFRIVNTYERINVQPISIGGTINLNAGTEAGASYTLNDSGHVFAYPFNRTTANTFSINRPFFGNVVAGTKTMLSITTSNVSALSNATLLRGIYFNPTVTDWASVIAFENTAGNVILGSTSGNVMIGTSTDAGYRLDVSGTTRVVSTGSTSGSTTLTLQNSTGRTTTEFRSDGVIGISSASTFTTQVTSVISASTTNSGIAIVPNGTGAFTLNIPDGTATGGDARGTNAIDLQTRRALSNQVASAIGSSILGGTSNKVNTSGAAGNNSVIVAGNLNTIQGNNKGSVFIGAGSSNIIDGNASVIVGGNSNTSFANSTFIGGGDSNTANGTLSIIVGGSNNQSSANYTTVVGGQSNTASASHGTVSGGQSNVASTGTHSTVIGGLSNTASGQYSIVGGQSNTSSTSNSSILGGWLNINSGGSYGSIVGGRSNVLSTGSWYSFIGAGWNNGIINGDYSVVVGGFSNSATTQYAAVIGGSTNRSSGLYSLTHGLGNIASSTGSTAIGFYNTASGAHSVAMGSGNTATGQGSVSMGIGNNVPYKWSTAFGATHTIGQESVFVAGLSNIVNGEYSTSMGNGNNVNGTAGVAIGRSLTVSGGYGAAFGYISTASGFGSLSVGYYATASGPSSVAIGSTLTAESTYGIALGYQSKATLYGQIAISSISLGSDYGNSQQSTVVASRLTSATSGGTITLSLDGTGTTNLIVPNGNNRAWNVVINTITVCTVVSGGTLTFGDAHAGEYKFLFKRVGGTSTISPITTSSEVADTSMATASYSFSAGTSQQMAITFNVPNTANNSTFRAVAKVALTEVAW